MNFKVVVGVLIVIFGIITGVEAIAKIRLRSTNLGGPIGTLLGIAFLLSLGIYLIYDGAKRR